MTRRSAAILGVLALVAWPAAGQVVVTPAPWVDGSGGARGTVTVPTGSSLLIAMAPPSTLAATPSQDGTDLAAGVYTITITALDAGGGETDDPTAITCTVAAGGAGRCALTWDAVPGAVSYRVWTSLVDVATPTRYFAAYTNAYNLDTLTGATVATLPTVGTAYVVSLSSTTVSWLGGPLYLEKNAISTTTTSGLSLVNNTAAATGVQQYSPGLSFIGQGWKTNATAASQSVEVRSELRPVEGAAAPTGYLAIARRVNEGAWGDVVGFGSGANASGTGAGQQLLVGRGSATAPAIASLADGRDGFYSTDTAHWYFVATNTPKMLIGDSGIYRSSDGLIGWNDGIDVSAGAIDLAMRRLAAASWAVGNLAGTAYGSITASLTGGAAFASHAISLEQDATTKVGTAPVGILTVVNLTDSSVAQFSLIGTGVVVELSDSSGNFSATKDNAATINVYYSVDGVYVQNKIAATKSLLLTRVGS